MTASKCLSLACLLACATHVSGFGAKKDPTQHVPGKRTDAGYKLQTSGTCSYLIPNIQECTKAGQMLVKQQKGVPAVSDKERAVTSDPTGCYFEVRVCRSCF